MSNLDGKTQIVGCWFCHAMAGVPDSGLRGLGL